MKKLLEAEGWVYKSKYTSWQALKSPQFIWDRCPLITKKCVLTFPTLTINLHVKILQTQDEYFLNHGSQQSFVVKKCNFIQLWLITWHHILLGKFTESPELRHLSLLSVLNLGVLIESMWLQWTSIHRLAVDRSNVPSYHSS